MNKRSREIKGSQDLRERPKTKLFRESGWPYQWGDGEHTDRTGHLEVWAAGMDHSSLLPPTPTPHPGHVLSMPHDDSKPCVRLFGPMGKYHMMAPFFIHVNKTLPWSPCSAVYLTELLDDGHGRPHSAPPGFSPPIGCRASFVPAGTCSALGTPCSCAFSQSP